MEKASGETINVKILEQIDRKCEELFRAAREESLDVPLESRPETEEVTDRHGNTQTIKTEDSQIFDALKRLIDELTFAEIDRDQIYDIPGFSINERSFRVYIPVTRIEKLAELIDADYG